MGIGEDRHEREDLYHTLVVAAAGVSWLAAVCFSPVLLLIFTSLATAFSICHVYIRAKGARDFARAPSGWHTCITEYESETARQLNISKALVPAIGGSKAQTFKRLFPCNGYLMVPSALLASPINNVSAKLVADLVTSHLAHRGLGHHRMWEEAFLLPVRLVPFLYPSYRRICELSADRIALRLSLLTQADCDIAQWHQNQFPQGTESVSTDQAPIGQNGQALKRISRYLYTLEPTHEQRVYELNRYRVRMDRRQRLHRFMRNAKPSPLETPQIRIRSRGEGFLGLIASLKGIVNQRRRIAIELFNRTPRRRISLTGPLAGVLVVCITAVMVFVNIDKIRLPVGLWNHEATISEAPAKGGQPENELVEAPRGPEHQQTIGGPAPEVEKPEQNTRIAGSGQQTVKHRQITTKTSIYKPGATESSLNKALRSAGHKGIKAVLRPDGSVALIGSALSPRQKKLAFVTVQTCSEATRIRDLVYVVEE